MKSTKNSYKNTENEKEKAMTTDQVWPVGHFFAPDDQAAKEARKQAFLTEARKKAKEVYGMLTEKWDKTIALAIETFKSAENIKLTEKRIIKELHTIAENYLGTDIDTISESRYWLVKDGLDEKFFDTELGTTKYLKTKPTFDYSADNTVQIIEQALAVCLGQRLVPTFLSSQDENEFKLLMNAASKNKITSILHDMAQRYHSAPYAKVIYWLVFDGSKTKYFDTKLLKIWRNENLREYRNYTVETIEQALLTCLKQKLVPVKLSINDKNKFRQLMNDLLDIDKKKMESIDEDTLDPFIKEELDNIIRYIKSYKYLSEAQFWNIEGRNLVFDTKLLALYPTEDPYGGHYIVYCSPSELSNYLQPFNNYITASQFNIDNLIKSRTRDLNFEFRPAEKEELIGSFCKLDPKVYTGYQAYIKRDYDSKGKNYIGLFHSGNGGSAETYLKGDLIKHISYNLWRKITKGDLSGYAIIPICRLVERKNGELNKSIERALQVCLENDLVPKDMPYQEKQKFKELIARYKETKVKDLTSVPTKASKAPAPAPKPVKPDYEDILAKLKTGTYTDNDAKFQQLKDYISQKDGKLSFDLDKFMKDVREGRFKKTVNDFDYDINSRLASGEGSPEQRKAMELSSCDYYRANLAAYPVS